MKGQLVFVAHLFKFIFLTFLEVTKTDNYNVISSNLGNKVIENVEKCGHAVNPNVRRGKMMTR